mmetsp:Transcript_32151/g.75504  ORF Transcript_32151/g.75504 Transcript_32151/m.75504 type:complete len:107 (+) Transcript_32151:95-415(+)|eukprot:CAMPEP_0178414126 /NCGR_PEP_ID=MMETSP0689_2-20121128/22876_1 /TAXON_ID=160604 /ORGANISM="Amphidinium massartii, Strain CS-259" /LENGTH=106 /DNA_ID=CAMNT_0020035407 /DNA_START=74 /DNA_END=394 /DNA_ORIENTATION=+
MTLAVAARSMNVGARRRSLRESSGVISWTTGGGLRMNPHGKSGNPAFSSKRETEGGIAYQAGSGNLDSPVYKPLVPHQEVEVPCRTGDAAFMLSKMLMADYYASLE